MLNVAICEDCPMQTEVIQMLLDKYQANRCGIELCAQSFSSGSELLCCVDRGHHFNLFLLDILMPGKSGIEFARELREQDANVPLIFLTSSEDYALEAFGVSAAQYILKPVTESKLFPVLDRIIARQGEERSFAFSTQGKMIQLPFSSIICVELVGRALQISLLDGETLLGSSLRIPFDEAVASLLKDDRFLHAHKSFVINMTHVAALGRGSFAMKNGIQVPVPRRRYAESKAKYLAFLSERGASFVGRK